MSDPSKLPPPVLAMILAGAKRSVHNAEAASLAIWLMNYLETLDLEVAYLWPISWKLVDTLVLVLRYVPLLQITFSYALGPDTPWARPEHCQMRFLSFIALTFIGVRLAEALLFIRTYAIVGKTRKWKWYLIAHFTMFGVVAPFVLLITNYTSSRFFQPTFLDLQKFGCGMFIGGYKWANPVTWALTLTNETLMLGVAIIMGYQNYRFSRSPLVTNLYRNGAFYFVAFALVTTANLVTAQQSPPNAFFMAVIQNTLHSIFATRLILGIRAMAPSDESRGATGASDGSAMRISNNLRVMRSATGRKTKSSGGAVPSILARLNIASPQQRGATAADSSIGSIPMSPTFTGKSERISMNRFSTHKPFDRLDMDSGKY